MMSTRALGLLHGLCLALWDFLGELADVINRNDASGVWIADDLTVVVTRDRAEHIPRTCQVELPQYGMETSPGKGSGSGPCEPRTWQILPNPPRSTYFRRGLKQAALKKVTGFFLDTEKVTDL